jgi:hypothetical protein
MTSSKHRVQKNCTIFERNVLLFSLELNCNVCFQIVVSATIFLPSNWALYFSHFEYINKFIRARCNIYYLLTCQLGDDLNYYYSCDEAFSFPDSASQISDTFGFE